MAIKGIDFAALPLKDALDLAVLVEEEAKERYEEFADQMTKHRNATAASFFRFMASNEAKHGSELLARRVQLFKDAPSAVSRQMLFDVEAPEYDEVRAFMTAREALQAAWRAEKKAYAFFNEAIPRISDPAVKKLFEELRAEEVQHQTLVAVELERTPPDPLIRADDVADEPVAQ
jgi:erythrin-vacuolar iron transport family protein